MQKFKPLSFLLTLCLLAGCGSTHAAPVDESDSPASAFTDDGVDMIKTMDGLDSTDKMSTGYWGIGTEMPDIEATTYDGKQVNLNNTKGKKTVVEYVAYWCSYCQKEESEYMPKLIADNPDIVFVQVFADGSKDYTTDNGNIDAIAQFYTSAGVDMSSVTHEIIQENNAIVSYAANELHISEFPSFYFYDESGKAAWHHQGTLTEDKFKEIADLAFGDKSEGKLYNNLVSGISQANTKYRGWKQVKADVSSGQQKAVSGLSLDSEYGEAAYYSNYHLPVHITNKLVGLDGSVVDLDDAKGFTAYAFFNASAEDLQDQLATWNKYAKVSDCGNLIGVLVGSGSSEATTEYNSWDIKPDTPMIENNSDLPSELQRVRIFGTPQIVYVNEDAKETVGGYYGEWKLDAMQSAEKVMLKYR